jgi:hypothetical protein
LAVDNNRKQVVGKEGAETHVVWRYKSHLHNILWSREDDYF